MIGRLGNHEISGVVGRGSNGIVFKAFDGRLNRIVAIKLLSPSFQSDDLARQRFEREVRAIATVVHENVVSIHSVDEFDGIPYFVMPYFPAGSLQKRINEKGALSTCEVIRLGMQIAKGLSEAHKQGIIHRDIKPANVLLEPGVDRAYVSDFGLAQISDDALLTRTGVLAGTPEYMSPEQVNGQLLDARSDLISLGSVMFTSCTGQSPFHSDTVFGVMKKVSDAEPGSIRGSNSDVPKWLDAFIARLHSPDPKNRFESSDEVAKLLEAELAYLNAPAVSNEPLRTWYQDRKQTVSSRRLLIAIALICITVFAALSMWQFAPNLFTANRSHIQQLQETQGAALSSEGVPSPDQVLRHKIETQKEVVRLVAEGKDQLAKLNLLRASESFRSAIGLALENDEAQAGLTETNQELELCLASYEKACAHAKRHESDDAIRWLEKAIKDGFRDTNSIEHDQELDNLRDDDRFKKLLQSLIPSTRVGSMKPL